MDVPPMPISGVTSLRGDGELSGSGTKKSRPVHVLILSSVMLTFIGIWSTAAVVLCDLASTAYYIGGVVEAQIGKAAPWYILAVMVFSYAVRGVYIESCALFVRGGVYRIVRETMGHGMAKVAVSALMFDYVLTGPISAVSAGHYLVRLFNDLLRHFRSHILISEKWCASVVAIAVVLYFYQSNLRGIQASSSKAIKIMWVTTAMAAVMAVWCLITLAVCPETRSLPPWQPQLGKKVDANGTPAINEVTKKQEDPLGWIGPTSVGEALRPGHVNWLSLVGALGLLIAFGHSILAMSGEETLAQVYREVKAPKLTNFKWVGFIVFVYSLAITGLISFFAVMIIPDGVRERYQENLVSGLALHVVGPHWAKLGLNAFVVIVGFLILAGSVNTSIVGANGVLNRIAEDGVLPAWFQRPLKTYGTTWRLLTLIAAFQVATIVITGGDVILLGEAYAFGVVWSLTLMSLSMLILRFTEPGRYREYRVPLNIRLGRRELPLGLALITLILTAAALANLLTKTVATVSGVTFSGMLLVVFYLSERFTASRQRQGGRSRDKKLSEHFQLRSADKLSSHELGLDRHFRTLVWVRSTDDLSALERCLVETDTDKTDIVAVVAHPEVTQNADSESQQNDVVEEGPQSSSAPAPTLTDDDRELMSAIVNRSERAGKPVKPIVLLSDDPPDAVVTAACDIGANELIISPVPEEPAAVEIDQIEARWRAVLGPLTDQRTVRLIAKSVDLTRDIRGGAEPPRAPDDGGETARALSNASAD